MFIQVVQLYRLLGCPIIEQSQFAFQGTVDAETLAHLKSMHGISPNCGSFELEEITGNAIKIEFSLPSNDQGQFYSSVDDFIRKTPTLEKGVVPEQFYIQNLDFYSKDMNVPEQIKKLFKFCEFIRLLSLLASDAPTGEDTATSNRLLFILSADGKSPAKTIPLQTKFDPDLLKCELPFLRFMYVLTSDGRRNQMHIEERSMILRNAIAEILQLVNSEENGNPFLYLVKNWAEVYTKYRHNFQAFLSQYSFEKVRKDIANAEIEYATKLSGVLADIAGKLLALPVSLAGLVLLRKADDNFEFFVGAISIISISVIFIAVLYNQRLQVKRLKESFEFVFGQYDDKLNEFPPKFRSTIIKAKQAIQHQGQVLYMTFFVFWILAASPIFIVIFMLICRYFVNDCGTLIHDMLFDVCSESVI
jgi:hypothetical protein